MTETDEGWGVIRPGDRKAHYYRQGMSLCRRVGFYTEPLGEDDVPSRDDCAKCRYVRDQEKGRQIMKAQTEIPRGG